MEAIAGLAGILWLFLFIVAVLSLFIPFWIYRIRNEIIAQTTIQRATLKLMIQSSKEEDETEKQEEEKSGIDYCFNCISYHQLSGECRKTRFNIDTLKTQDPNYYNPCKYKYFHPKSEKRSIS